MLCCVTSLQALNQVVLWDKIVLRGESTKLRLRETKSKYFFFDDGNGLRYAFIISCIFFFVLLLTLRKVIHYLCILPKEQDIHLQFSLCPLVFVLPQAIFV